jgi:phosphopantothenoylcysteine synthetase/decarboxylase
VSEYESAVANAMNNVADAIRTLAGVAASIAAAAHTENTYDQRQMAAVIFQDAQERFADPLKKISKRKRDEMARWIDGLCKQAKP